METEWREGHQTLSRRVLTLLDGRWWEYCCLRCDYALMFAAAVLQPHGDPLKTNLCLANGRYIPGLNIQQQHIRFYATCVGGY